MITATVSITASVTALRDLINTAVTNKLPTGFGGRAYQVILIPSAATVKIVDSNSAGNNQVTLPTTPTVLQAPTGNQIALEEIFLVGAGTETVGVIVLVL